MESNPKLNHWSSWPTLAAFPKPAKALITAIIVTMAIAMAGALGQIIIHDIIPTFYSGTSDAGSSETVAFDATQKAATDSSRGDLFAEAEEAVETTTEAKAFHKTEQFVWLLKWTHIHLFGMNMIFIFVGGIATCLNYSIRLRTWLVALPFLGVLVDIAAMWLKAYMSPLFFWLHVPGGGLFGLVFCWVSLRAIREMWLSNSG